MDKKQICLLQRGINHSFDQTHTDAIACYHPQRDLELLLRVVEQQTYVISFKSISPDQVISPAHCDMHHDDDSPPPIEPSLELAVNILNVCGCHGTTSFVAYNSVTLLTNFSDDKSLLHDHAFQIFRLSSRLGCRFRRFGCGLLGLLLALVLNVSGV